MLTPVMSHPWDLSPREAIALQRDLAARVERRDRLDTVHLVAGIDVSVRGDRSRAAVVVMRLPELDVVEEVLAERPVTFPYVPGLLSFREAPSSWTLWHASSTPRCCSATGRIAHPRRLGIASHPGRRAEPSHHRLRQSRLTGAYSDPRPSVAAIPGSTHDDVIGAVLRTRSASSRCSSPSGIASPSRPPSTWCCAVGRATGFPSTRAAPTEPPPSITRDNRTHEPPPS